MRSGPVAGLLLATFALATCGRTGIPINGGRLLIAERIVDARPGVDVLESSAAIDPLGGAHIGYYDAGSQVLRYARTLGNGSWKLEVVDPTPDSGSSVSLALDPLNQPNLAYAYRIPPPAGAQTSPGGGLRLAFWDGQRWNIAQLVTGQDVGLHASMGIDRAGVRKIAYLDLSTPGNAAVDYLEWSGSTPRMQTVVTGITLPQVGQSCQQDSDCGGPLACDLRLRVCSDMFKPYVALALDPAGGPHLCFYDERQENLRYASRRPDGSWRLETVEWRTVHGERLNVVPALNPSPCPGAPTLGAHLEAPLTYPSSASQEDTVVYRNGQPVANSGYGFCGTQAIYLLPSSYQDGDVMTLDYVRTDTSPEQDGMNCSLAVASDGTVHVSYLARVGVPYQLKYAVRTNGEWKTSIVDGFGVAAGCDCISGMSNSLALDPFGNPSIAYLDSNNIDLRLMHWVGAGWLGGTIDSANYTGLNPSLAYSVRGVGGVSYRERRFDTTTNLQRGILKFSPLAPFPPS